ncbi:hypothetical protein ILUMI_18608 [Ignelater luminosus]|uniref:Uncharacterized protein n=1 Tax=Ignelater luminosus TaxID=2038154 RepID=A0A8K0G0Q6_IGNLU|nr:hypothetical protein ILUMI_18608 [Ignelater luminosus]
MFGTKIKSSIPGISKCRSVIFSAASKPEIKESMGGLTYSTPYKKFIKIKDKKLENIKFLVTQQQSDQEFYKILSDQSAEKPKGENALESDAKEYE